MGADNSFYVKSIATYAPTFFGYIISVLAIVISYGIRRKYRQFGFRFWSYTNRNYKLPLSFTLKNVWKETRYLRIFSSFEKKPARYLIFILLTAD